MQGSSSFSKLTAQPPIHLGGKTHFLYSDRKAILILFVSILSLKQFSQFKNIFRILAVNIQSYIDSDTGIGNN